jgi:hypothetical protein
MIVSLPAGLNEVVLKTLAKNPQDRYASGAEMIAALRRTGSMETPSGHQQFVNATAASAELKDNTERLDAQALVAAANSSPKSASLRMRAMWAAGAAAILLIGGAMRWHSHYANAPLIPPGVAASLPDRSTNAPEANASGSSAVSKQAQLGSTGSGQDQTAEKPSAFGTIAPDSTGGSTDSSTDPGQSGNPSASQGKGRVLIRTLPAGAVVRVNDDATEYRSPVNFALAPGHYQITVEHAGFRTETKEIDIEANRDVTMDVEMRRGLFRRLNPFRR